MSKPDKPLGQIYPASRFGQMLTSLAEKSKIIVEIGTWYGEGSTRSIYRGMKEPWQEFYSYETSEEAYRVAYEAYKPDSRVHIVLGAISLEPGMDPALRVDSKRIPAQIDLLLIDGGPTSGKSDFDRLFSRCTRFIALDDTNEEKNLDNANWLRQNWKTVVDVRDERNGWGVWEKR